MALWTPDVDLNEKRSLDFDSAALPDGPVANCTDKVNGVVASQPVVANRPIMNAAAGGVGHSGTLKYLTFPCQSDPTRYYRTLIALLEYDISGTGQSGVFLGVNGYQGSGDNCAPSLGYVGGAGSTLTAKWALSATHQMALPSNNVRHVVVVRRLQGKSYISVDGSVETVAGTNVLIPRNATNQPGRIGDFRTPVIPWTWNRFILATEITDDELARVQGWAMWSMGVQANLKTTHPYFNAPPQSRPYVNRFPIATQAEWDAVSTFWKGTPLSSFGERNYGQPIDPAYMAMPVVFEERFTAATAVVNETDPAGSSFYACTFDAATAAASQRSLNQTPATYANDGAESAIKMQKVNTTWYSGGFCSINIDGQGNAWNPAHGPVLFEWSMRLTPGKGTWPGLWVKARQEMFDGTTSRLEIDVMEGYGGDPQANHNSVHIWPASRVLPGRTATHKYQSNYSGLKAGGHWPLAPASVADNTYHNYKLVIDPRAGGWFIYYMDDREQWRAPALSSMFQWLYILVDLALNPAEVSVAVSPCQMGLNLIRVRQLMTVPTKDQAWQASTAIDLAYQRLNNLQQYQSNAQQYLDTLQNLNLPDQIQITNNQIIESATETVAAQADLNAAIAIVNAYNVANPADLIPLG